jgi:hypothetical protein
VSFGVLPGEFVHPFSYLFAGHCVSSVRDFSSVSHDLSKSCRARLRNLLLVSLYRSPPHFSCNGLPQRVWENPLKKRFLRHASVCCLLPALRLHRLDTPCAFGHRSPAFNPALLSQARPGNKPRRSDRPDISLSGEMMFCAGFMQGITNMNRSSGGTKIPSR